MERKVPPVLSGHTGKDVGQDGSRAESKDFVDMTQPLECAVCLQTCIHPVQLQCRHIFCFLCVKGVAIQSTRCPMCRREIPPDYLDHPDLVQGPLELVLEDSTDLHDDLEVAEGVGEASHTRHDEFRWFYEGRNGWWEYDVRTAQDLEQCFKSGDTSCEMLIAGFLYIIDFQNMFQYRRNEPNRRRRIKHDLLSNIENWKGVAGLRPLSSSSNENLADSQQPDDITRATLELSDNLSSLSLTTDDSLTTTRVGQIRAVSTSTSVSNRESGLNDPNEDNLTPNSD